MKMGGLEKLTSETQEKSPEMSVVGMFGSEMEARGTIKDVVKHGVEHSSERKWQEQ